MGKENSEKIILGIDPGTNIMGYGIIAVRANKMNLIDLGSIKIKKQTGHELKLKEIFECCMELVVKYLPDEMAIESPFYGKNIQAMLKLGRAQGVAMAAAMSREIPIVEYAPRKIKQSVTGNGNASKAQVASMLYSIFNIKSSPTEDATDALAIAVCHHFQKGINKQPRASWDSFVKNNPERLR